MSNFRIPTPTQQVLTPDPKILYLSLLSRKEGVTPCIRCDTGSEPEHDKTNKMSCATSEAWASAHFEQSLRCTLYVCLRTQTFRRTAKTDTSAKSDLRAYTSYSRSRNSRFGIPYPLLAYIAYPTTHLTQAYDTSMISAEMTYDTSMISAEMAINGSLYSR